MKEITSDVFPLSEIQQAYYIGRNREFELGGKSTQVTYIFETELECASLENALNIEIKRQPMLRAVVLNENEQKILEDVPSYSIRYLDFSDNDTASQKEMLTEEKRASFAHQFDPASWPLFEWKYIHADKNYLMISFDLLIADGSSLMLLAHEIRMICDGKASELPDLDITYHEYIEEKRSKKSGKKYQNDKNYWLSQLESIPDAPKLNYRKMRSHNIKGDEVNRAFISLAPAEWKHFSETCEKKNISQSTGVMAAYAEVLRYWSNEKSFTINMTVTERRKKTENLIGDFTASLLIPVDDDDDHGNFWVHAGHMKKTFINSYRHSSFEGVEVIKEITRRKNMPLMAVMPIVFTSLLFKDKSYDRIFEIGRLTDAVSKTPQVIIDCQAEENSGQLIVTWDYAEEYIDRKTILKMQEQMKKILLLASDEKDISPAFALPDDDLQIWKKYNDTDVRTDKTSLIELFMHSAEKYPDRRAVSIGDLSYTYSELNELSAARAVELTKNGAVSGSNIAVTARRNMDTIVNILAVLRIGAAYVPVAADAGRERIRYIINNSGCELALDDSVIKISAHAHESEINDRTAGDVSSELAPVRAAGFHSDIGHSNTDSLKNFSGSRAYIIYTSGTTGKPKGVSIANESAANTILDMNDRLEVTEDDRFIGISSLTFDLSVYDIFGAFCAGAELVLVPDSRNPELLKKIVREKSITIWNSVPSFVKLFLMSVKQGDVFKSVRHIMMSGDWIPVQLPEQIAAHFINTDILSLGGATEASIWSIYYPVRSTDKNWKSIPYGYPLANQKIYVMDRNMKLCPVSVPGEICIGGTGLAIGYCNDPEKTSDAFVMTEEFGRLYKTGDSGVLSPEGYVRIIGRIDFQMKINGFRIEAGEIESVACRYSDKINSAVAVPLHENTQLCLALETEENVNKTEFCRFLSEYLPPYMIASQIICLKKMPLTANGKISRKDIIRQAEHRISAAAVKPETELERQIYEIWKQVLNRSDFGIRDSFFELGGDSLKAAEVYYRLEEQGIKLEISKLFMFSTIEQLAYEIEQLDYSNELISGETGEI